MSMIRGLILGAALWLSLMAGAMTVESDALAFYPFLDQPVGTRYDRTTSDLLTNAVATAYPGSVLVTSATASKKTYYGSLTFDDDVPGRYVYSDWAATNLLSEVQSVHVKTNDSYNSRKVGAYLSFTDLADELRDRDEYTIEFFYKNVNTNYSTVCFSFFQWTNINVMINYKLGVRVSQGDDYGSYGNNGSCAYRDYYGLNEKHWHHIAIVRKDDSLKVYCDYLYKSSAALPLLGKDQESPAGRPFLLGIFNRTYQSTPTLNFHTLDTRFCALRVSTTARTPEQFLLALPQKRTGEFHWSFSEAGSGSAANAAMVSNNYATTDYASARERLFWTAYDTGPFDEPDLLADCLGAGSVFVDTIATAKDGGVLWQTGRTKPRVLQTAGRVLTRENARSLYFDTVCNDNGQKSYMPSGGGLKSSSGSAVENLSGFTYEGFFRLDSEAWSNDVIKAMEACYEATSKFRYRVAILGLRATNETAIGVFRLAIYSDRTTYQKGLKFRFAFQTSASARADEDVSLKKSDDSKVFDLYEWADTWHHVAVTYDSATPLTATVWIDYTPFVLTLTYPLALDEAKRWECCIGSSIGDFMGDVDEVRLTRRVLAPGEFLRMRPLRSGSAISVR